MAAKAAIAPPRTMALRGRAGQRMSAPAARAPAVQSRMAATTKLPGCGPLAPEVRYAGHQGVSLGLELVHRPAPGQRQVGEDVRVPGGQFLRPQVVEDGPSQVAALEVGVAQVVKYGGVPVSQVYEGLVHLGGLGVLSAFVSPVRLRHQIRRRWPLGEYARRRAPKGRPAPPTGR